MDRQNLPFYWCYHLFKNCLEIVPSSVLVRESLHMNSSRLQPLMIFILAHILLVELVSNACVPSHFLDLPDGQECKYQHKYYVNPALKVIKLFVV